LYAIVPTKEANMTKLSTIDFPQFMIIFLI
jgi:hypothetical protein